MKRRIMEALGIPDGCFGRFDIIAEDNPIEIEAGSNRNDQIYENVRKSVEEFGFARFVVADEVTYNAVLQQAARYRFEGKGNIKLSLITFDRFTKGNFQKLWGFYLFTFI